MNKKIISIILSLVLLFGIVMMISGCNKDDNTMTPDESTNAIVETEPTTEESSAEETESVTQETSTESTSKNNEITTEASTNSAETTETTQPAVCEICGGLIVDESDTSVPVIGNYCDGYCDEWLGF